MDSPDITKLLPPILLGFGGVIPLLVAKAPFSVREGLKPLMAAIFILVTWASYLASYMLCTKWFYDYKITLWLLTLAVIVFVVLYFVLRPHVSGEEEKNLSPAPWIFVTYAAAISLLAASAANYVGPKGYVVVDLKAVDPAGKVTMRISEVAYTVGSQKYFLRFTETGGGISSALMQKALFDKLPILTVKIATSSWTGKALNDKYEVDKEALQLILHPSLTERFAGTIKTQYAPEE